MKGSEAIGLGKSSISNSLLKFLMRFKEGEKLINNELLLINKFNFWSFFLKSFELFNHEQHQEQWRSAKTEAEVLHALIKICLICTIFHFHFLINIYIKVEVEIVRTDKFSISIIKWFVQFLFEQVMFTILYWIFLFVLPILFTLMISLS